MTSKRRTSEVCIHNIMKNCAIHSLEGVPSLSIQDVCQYFAHATSAETNHPHLLHVSNVRSNFHSASLKEKLPLTIWNIFPHECFCEHFNLERFKP